MEFSELIKKIRGSAFEKDLICLNDINSQEDIDRISEEIGSPLPTYEEMTFVVDYLNRDRGLFYLNMSSMWPFCYFNSDIGAIIEINILTAEGLEMFQTAKRIEVVEKTLSDFIKNQDFEGYFTLVDSKIKLYMFKKLFNEIPDDKKYEIFIGIYTGLDYGFVYYGHEFIKEVLKYKPENSNTLKKLKRYVDSENKITVYRGMDTESSPLSQAYSWTVDFNTALFFATRHSREGKGGIYTTRVSAEHIIDFLNNRNEKEVLISPENIISAEKMEFSSIEETAKIFNDEKFLGMYHRFCKNINTDYFHNPTGIHGPLHAKRVLFLCLIMGKLLGLRVEDIMILGTAAVYHDIGRRNDEEDTKHGEWSMEKADDLNLLHKISKEDRRILCYIVENHCVDDNRAFSRIKKYAIRDKERAINLLNIFKDADGLDRVRFRGLDIKYLRTEPAKRLPIVAQYALHGIK